MQFSEVIQKRYSCKKYSDRPLDGETLKAILEAGRLAPTAKNSQPQHIYVVQSAEKLAAVDALTPCRYGAPVVLVITYNPELIFHYPGQKYDSGAEDVSIVATHMMLAAADLGVDSCWLNFFDPEAVAKALDLPDNQTVVLMLDLGYRAEGSVPLPAHSNRKPLAETVSYL